jgi:F-type H+-transporting ATPase subunit gamma
METLEAMRRKLNGARELMSVVKTMKALAAVNIRQVERAVQSLAQYDRTVQMALQVVGRRAPELLATGKPAPTHRRLIIVLGTDQGMAGPFNDIVAADAVRRMKRVEPLGVHWTVWACGVRAEARLERLGCNVQELFEVPASVTAIHGAVQEILLQVEAWHSLDHDARVDLAFNRPASGAACEPHHVRLLPVNQAWLRSFVERRWPSRVLPTFTMEPAQLLSALVRQFLFVTLYRTLAESLAAENAARLAAMQVAEKNISERLEELRTSYHQQRQSLITEELMDVISGFEALTDDDGLSDEDESTHRPISPRLYSA